MQMRNMPRTLTLSLTLIGLVLAGATPAFAEADREPPVTSTEPGGIAGANDWWHSDVTVRLACTDNLECLKTEFAVDGSDWALYEDPFPVAGDGIHTVLARSQDKNSNIEPTNTLLVRIDTVAPNGAVVVPAPGRAYLDDTELPLPVDLPYTVIVGDLTLRAEAADATSGVDRVEFWIDGALRGTATEAPYTWVWPAGEEVAGGHVAEVVVHDVAGHRVRDGIHVVTLPDSQEGVENTVG